MVSAGERRRPAHGRRRAHGASSRRGRRSTSIANQRSCPPADRWRKTNRPSGQASVGVARPGRARGRVSGGPPSGPPAGGPYRAPNAETAPDGRSCCIATDTAPPGVTRQTSIVAAPSRLAATGHGGAPAQLADPFRDERRDRDRGVRRAACRGGRLERSPDADRLVAPDLDRCHQPGRWIQAEVGDPGPAVPGRTVGPAVADGRARAPAAASSEAGGPSPAPTARPRSRARAPAPRIDDAEGETDRDQGDPQGRHAAGRRSARRARRSRLVAGDPEASPVRACRPWRPAVSPRRGRPCARSRSA